MDDFQRVRREDLRTIAGNQKGILICILVYLIAVAAQFAIPDEMRILLGIGVIVVGVVATVFVFRLATKLYSRQNGIVLTILTVIPIVGLIVLLVINGKATNILKQHGVHVGLLGARMSDLD